MKFLTKITNYFKNKADLIDLIEEQAIKNQEIENQLILIKQGLKSLLENN
jgi:AcrR family transcriptional regulator